MTSSAPKTAPVKAASPSAPAGRASLGAGNSGEGYTFKVQFASQLSLLKIAGSLLLSVLLLAGMYYAWQHPKGPDRPPQQSFDRASSAASAMDHVAAAPDTAEVHLISQPFSVKAYQAFPFVVPAHMIHPRLHGQFQTLSGANAAKTVDVLLMKEHDYDEFAQQRPSDAVSFQQGASGGTIDWIVPPTILDAQKYYLVFVNSNEDSATSVNADFTISFE
jgi:hypothetical protein